MIFDGCILASDYDGTLAKSDGIISDEVREAIKYFTSNGGKFTVCTGRTKQGFNAFDRELMNAPILLGNGAMAFDYLNNKTVFLNCIDKESADEIRYIRDSYSDIGIEIYGSDFSSYVINPHKRNIEHFVGQNIEYEVVDDVPESVFPAIKVMVSVGKDRCLDFQRFLDEISFVHLKYIPQYGDFIEIISKNTDKGVGLRMLAEKIGVKSNRIFAIGDGANDVSMLKAAKIGFVPENGDDYAKAVGDIVVKSNNDGAVADAIYRIESIINEH